MSALSAARRFLRRVWRRLLHGKPTTVKSLLACARFLRDHHRARTPDVDYITFGLATEYLRAVVGNEWTNQAVFGQHPNVDRRNRAARDFMKAEATTIGDQFRNQARVTRLAEMLFNLRSVVGLKSRLDQLRSDAEATYAELEMGAFLCRQGVQLKYVEPSGLRGADYDAEITLPDGPTLNCEMKCKIEDTKLSEGAIRSPLQKARKQLSPDAPGLVFMKIPEAWVSQQEAGGLLPSTIGSFLAGTSRVIAVIVWWEEQLLAGPQGGAVTFYRFRLERGPRPKVVAGQVDDFLASLGRRTVMGWVRFRDIAEQVLREQRVQ